jgi:hypothetical protein
MLARTRLTRPGRSRDVLAWLAVLLVIPALLPLAAPGYFTHAHDAPHSLFFVVEFDQAVRSGALWPVWAPDQAIGFGYPLWLVIAPLAFAVAEVFHLIGLNIVTAVKVTWALCFVVGALGSYRLARRWWGPLAGLVASVAFTYGPYHLVQIYVRGDLAEFAALAAFPWALLAFVNLLDEPRPKRLALAGLSMGVLLLTHTVSELLYVPLLAVFVAVKLLTGEASLLRFRRTRPPVMRAVYACAALVLGVAVAAIFMLPAFFERQYIVQAQFVRENYSYLKQFVYPSQLFSPYWGFGYAVEGANDEMSFQLGLLPLLGALVGAWAALRGRLTERSGTSAPLPRRTEALFLAVASIVIIAAMLPIAEPLWRAVPLVSLIQFPWRLLTLTTVTLSLLAGLGAHYLECGSSTAARSSAAATDDGTPYVYGAVLLIALAGFTYTQPQLFDVPAMAETPYSVIDFELRFPDMRGMTQWSERVPANEDSPLLAQYKAGQPLQRVAILQGSASILSQHADAVSISAQVRADAPARVRIYTYYFPGWRATIDGQPVAISPDPPNGLIGLDVPAGEHAISVRFGPTPLRAASAAITILALLASAGLWWFDRKTPLAAGTSDW